jgi:hypothetical protein
MKQRTGRKLINEEKVMNLKGQCNEMVVEARPKLRFENPFFSLKIALLKLLSLE